LLSERERERERGEKLKIDKWWLCFVAGTFLKLSSTLEMDSDPNTLFHKHTHTNTHTH